MKKFLLITPMLCTLAIISTFATTYTVTVGTGFGPGTLYKAIEDANLNAGADVINFAIGTGAQTITGPTLPDITESLIIDGSTQPGYVSTPLITIADGGLNAGTSSNVTIKYLIITGTPAYGIHATNCNGITLIGNIIQNIASSIYIDAGTSVTDIHDNELNGATSFALNLYQPTAIAVGAIHNNTFTGTFYGAANLDGLPSGTIISDGSVVGSQIIIEDNSGANLATTVCMYVANSPSVVIDNINASLPSGFSGNGIKEFSCTNFTIQNCSAQNRETGIFTNGGSITLIKSNDLTNSGSQGALYIYNPSGIAVGGVKLNTFGGGFCYQSLILSSLPSGTIVSDGSVVGTHIIIEDNSGANLATQYCLNLADDVSLTVDNVNVSCTVAGNATGIYVNACTNCTIRNVDATTVAGNGGYGIFTIYGSNITIDNVDASCASGHDGYGIVTYYSDNVDIQNCTIHHRGNAIKTDFGSITFIKNNNLSSSQYALTVNAPTAVPVGAIQLNTFTSCFSGVTLTTLPSSMIISDGSIVGSHIILEDNSGLNTVTNGCLNINNSAGVIIENIHIIPLSPYTTADITANSCNNLIVRNCSLANSAVALYINGGSVTSIRNNNLSNSFGPLAINTPTSIAVGAVQLNTFGGFGNYYGVELQYLPSGTIISDGSVVGSQIILEDNCGLSNTVFMSINSPLMIINSPGTIITGLDLSLYGTGDYGCPGLTLQDSPDAVISSLKVKNRFMGVRLEGTSNHYSIACSYFCNCSAGIYDLSAYNVLGSVISNSVFIKNPGYAVFAYHNATTAINNYWGAEDGPLNDGGSGGYYFPYDGQTFTVLPFSATVPPCVCLLFNNTEENIIGNTMSIADGDATPSTSDATDFGSTNVGVSVSETYTIENNGSQSLDVFSVTFAGVDASMFYLSSPPAATVAPNDFTTFTVDFNPTSAGLKHATIIVTAEDCDETNYNFDVQGTGTSPCTDPDEPTVAATHTTICNGNSTTLSVTAGLLNDATAWHWYSGSCNGTTVGAGTSLNVSPTSTTTYYVRGEGGCVTPGSCASIMITVVSSPTFIITSQITNVACKGNSTGAIDVSVSGGTEPLSYLWNNGSTNQDIVNLHSGVYTVTVRDANLCSATATFTITQPSSLLTINITKTNVRCGGKSTGLAMASPSGGVSPYYYLWGNGSTADTRNNLVAGNYTVTVTDAAGCVKTKTFTITENLAQSVYISPGGNPNQYLANNAGGVGPYSFSWNTSPVQTNQTATIIATGNYKVKVTDSKGCTVLSSSYHVARTGQTITRDFGIMVTPNPTSGLLSLTVQNCINCNVTINLFDIVGKMVYSNETKIAREGSYGEGATLLDFSGLAKGVYSMQIMYDGKSEVLKVLKE